MNDDRSRANGPDGPEAEEHQEAVEKRVMKVRHLDPFTVTCHADGRFMAQLEQPPSELKPDVARAILEKMDVVLEPLRRVAERRGEGGGGRQE